MSCCGEKRGSLQAAAPSSRAPARPAARRPLSYQSAFFVYTGKTRLVATGPATGRRYSFAQAGAIVRVDLRDRPHLARIPNLRQIRDPRAPL